MTDLALYTLTEEHEMIRQAAREFAQKEIAPVAAEYDETGEFPVKTVKKMGEMGFMGIEVPEDYGGTGMDTLAYVLALEEICKADAAHGTIMSVNNSLYSYGLLKFGTQIQKQKFITPIPGNIRVLSRSLFRQKIHPLERPLPFPCRGWSGFEKNWFQKKNWKGQKNISSEVFRCV